MKRLIYLLAVSVSFSAFADVTISDIWRWGLRRKSDASEWRTYAVTNGAVTVTNLWEAPVQVTGTGTVSVAFLGLRGPDKPVTFLIGGYNTVLWPSNTYFVGGGSWQTNRLNHFTVWSSILGTEIFVLPITTSELPQ